MARQESNLLKVLHVENDDDDAILLAKACDRAGLQMEVHRACDGQNAKAYLLGEGEFADRFKHPLPQIIILDLKMPQMDGFEFLKWLRGQKDFASLPVLVFTSSMSREDKARALAEGANSYFIKPASFDALVQIMTQCFNPSDPRHLN